MKQGILALVLVGTTGCIGYLIGAHYFADLYYYKGFYGYSGEPGRIICAVVGGAFGVVLATLLARKVV